jgi:parallel beta-helix repeat protein
MYDLRRKAIPYLLALTLLISMLASLAPVHAELSDTPLVVHQAIVVNSDEDLEALRSSGDVTGGGTANDPYIIENYEINATGQGNAIFLGNTSSFVVIRHCSFYGASISDWQYRYGAGVELFNATGVTVEGNNCTGNLNGIVLRSSTYNRVINNSVTGSQYGILLYTNSSQNTIMDNHCEGASYGIWLYTSCTNNTMYRNECLNNTAMGIFLLYGSENNTVEANSCSGGSQEIFLLQSGSCDIRRNHLTGSSLGIQLYRSWNCTVDDNVATGLGDLALYLYQSNNIMARNNTFTGNDIGFYVTESSNVTIENNNCSDNLYHGVYAYSSNHIKIRNNALDRNGNIGIYMYASSEVLIENNTISGNLAHGVYLSSISNVTIANNSVSHNTDFGMYLDRSSSILIKDNIIEGNARYGVYMYACTGNDIFGNAFLHNNGATASFNPSHRQAYDPGSNRWNSTVGNYWSDLSAPDSDGDGVVDQPYSIDGYASNVDHLPMALGINVTSSPGTYVNVSTVGIMGTASGPVGMKVQWRNNATNSSGACVGSDEWRAAVPLVHGINEIAVMVSDGVGNMVNDTIVVFQDTAGPNLSIVSPSQSSFLNSSTVVVNWQADDIDSGISSYAIQVDYGATLALPAETSSYSMELADGVHVVRVTVTDLAGNVGEDIILFTVDTIAPRMTFTLAGEGVGGHATLMMEFSEPMNDSSVVCTTDFTATSRWSGNVLEVISSSLFYNNEYTVTVTGEDFAGNAVVMFWTFHTAQAGNIMGGLVDDDGRAIANVTVTLSNGLTTITDETGHFAFENVSVGSYHITFIHEGHQTEATEVTVQAGETSELTTVMFETSVGAAPVDYTPMITVSALGVVAMLVLAFTIYRRHR